MTAPSAGPSNRKDLRDLRNLPRSPLMSFLQKQNQPRAPRPDAAALAPAKHPLLAAFDPRLVWKWITEYLGHRLGPRHPFLSYAKSDPDQGIYKLEGDDEEIRIALAGDWATGTDEADRIAQLITAFDPHYSIHLGDVYYVGDDDEVGENFLGIKNPENEFAPCRWPSGSRGTFALNGNHEMYALGRRVRWRRFGVLGRIISDSVQDAALRDPHLRTQHRAVNVHISDSHLIAAKRHLGESIKSNRQVFVIRIMAPVDELDDALRILRTVRR